MVEITAIVNDKISMVAKKENIASTVSDENMCPFRDIFQLNKLGIVMKP